MNIKTWTKKIWFSLYDSQRIVLLDYPVPPDGIYTKENDHPHEALSSLIGNKIPIYLRVLHETLKFKDRYATIVDDKLLKDGVEPGWNNGYLPGLDIIMLYSLLSQIKPTTYMEIGSGTSTKVAHKARKENSLSYQIISVDPAPRKNISKVSDRIYSQKVQHLDPNIFTLLENNDVLFYDGTHTLYPNSDVMWFFLEILPRLKKGVIVHIHDVYLPYDYPDFMLKRYYNEQYVLGALLLNNPNKYEILCPNYFIYSRDDLHSILNPIWELDALRNVERHGGSFWIKILS